jgi:DNA-binding PadR family transcriptional regulator
MTEEQDLFHNAKFRSGFRGGHGRGRGRGRHWFGEYSLVDVRLVEPALLAFLQRENLHGYGLIEKLEKIGLGSINPSVVYRILRDYEEIGFVVSDWDEEASQGPPRRVYSITEDGHRALNSVSKSLEETLERIKVILSEIQHGD